MEFPQQQTLVSDFDRLFKTLSAEQKEFWDEDSQAEGLAPPGAGQGIYGDGNRAARDARQTVRQRWPPRSIIRMPRSTSCWRSSRSPGCCATPAAKRRCLVSTGLAAGQMTPETHLKLYEILRRHRGRMERAGVDGGGHAVAAGACQRASPRPRPPISNRNTSHLRDRLLTAPDGRRKAGNDGEPMEPDHGRTSRCRGRVSPTPRSTQPRNHTAAQHSAALRSLVLQLVLLASALALTSAP